MDVVPEKELVSTTQAALPPMPLEGAPLDRHLWLELFALWGECREETKLSVVQTIVLLACFVCDYCESYEDEKCLREFDSKMVSNCIYYHMVGHGTAKGKHSVQLAALVHRLICSQTSSTNTRYTFDIDNNLDYGRNLELWGSFAGVQPKGDINMFRPDKLGRALSRTKVFDRKPLSADWCADAMNRIKDATLVDYPNDLNPIPRNVVLNLSPAQGHDLKLFIDEFRVEEAGESRAKLPVDLLFLVWACYIQPPKFAAAWLHNWILLNDPRRFANDILQMRPELASQSSVDPTQRNESSSWFEALACRLVVLYYFQWNTGPFRRCDRLPSNSLTGEFSRVLKDETVPDPLSVLRRVSVAVITFLKQKCEGNSNVLADILQEHIVSPADMREPADGSITEYLSRREQGASHEEAVQSTRRNIRDQEINVPTVWHGSSAGSEKRKRQKQVV
ncbi:hypothetical protein CGMCC3_g9870 [Colletotrichum fructicola]|nr:uncharacterized protein CGMCC3_g9870 [Colletotrichum fructicola]KAE9574037.1 hypothetical protein CGMCC3_g9870 [Colletotrichum fructicola]KAF4430808.1 hypothetical protein CFRS1_v009589 [Colletotrichum fructicola]